MTISVNPLSRKEANMREAVEEHNDTGNMKVEQMEIPLSELHPFPNQPFKVASDEAMDSLL